MADLKLCSLPDCHNKVFAKGWCGPHYKRWWRYGDPYAGGTFFGAAEKYYHEVVLRYESADCLIWPYGRGSHGYGEVHINGRSYLVHRLACEQIKGPAPTKKHEAAHSCGQGMQGCVNPNHLSWKTSAENHADKLLHGTSNRGERNGSSRFTESDVRAIRSLRGKMKQDDIAAMFGTERDYISKIHRGKVWGWLA